MIYRLERSRWVCCSQLTKDGASCPVHVSVSNSEATEFVKEWLRSLAGEYGESFDALVSERMKSQDASANRDVVEGQLLTEERRRENLVRAVSTGAFEAADVSDEMRLIKREMERLRLVLADLKCQDDQVQVPTESFERLLQSWDETDPSTMSVLLEQVLQGVYVYPFRSHPRMIARSVWEGERSVPRAEPPDLDFSQGRTCMKCQEWKPRDAFTVYGPHRKMKRDARSARPPTSVSGSNRNM